MSSVHMKTLSFSQLREHLEIHVNMMKFIAMNMLDGIFHDLMEKKMC